MAIISFSAEDLRGNPVVGWQPVTSITLKIGNKLVKQPQDVTGYTAVGYKVDDGDLVGLVNGFIDVRITHDPMLITFLYESDQILYPCEPSTKAVEMCDKLAFFTYEHDPCKNNTKYFQIIAYELDLVRAYFESIIKNLDIMTAEGQGLDMWGVQYNVYRNELSDYDYRALILFERDKPKGLVDINNVIDIIATAFDLDPDSIQLVEYLEESGVIQRIYLPREFWKNTSLTLPQTLDMIESIIASGVRLNCIFVRGGFRFSLNPNDSTYDSPEHGFGDPSVPIGGGLSGGYCRYKQPLIQGLFRYSTNPDDSVYSSLKYGFGEPTLDVGGQLK